MERNGLRQIGDILGMCAYLTVLGAGVPDLRVLRAGVIEERALEEKLEEPRDVFVDTVPYEFDHEREEVPAA